MKIREIISAIEAFAPTRLKEAWDNPGLQIGCADWDVASVVICLDVTEEILREAIQKGCNLIISHHPLLFKGLKQISGATPVERIVIEAIKHDIAIYAAHTNLDSAIEGVSHEMANQLGMTNLRVLCPQDDSAVTGLGIIGDIKPMAAMEFMRQLKDVFGVKSLRYSSQSPQLVVRRVAMCGGAGAEFIGRAVEEGADIYVTGDVKYHDFTTFGSSILIADIGHYESELCTEKIFARLLHENFPDLRYYLAKSEVNPIAII